MGSEDSADAIVGRAFGRFSQIRDAIVFPMSPPPIRELGTESGFVFRLQDRASKGNDALVAAKTSCSNWRDKARYSKTSASTVWKTLPSSN